MSLFEDIKKGMPEGIVIPPGLYKLCNWSELNGQMGGSFELRADDGNTMRYWFGFNDVSDRFGLFGAGSTGDIYAIWKNDNGTQKIVHLGSEGDAKYILADNFVDFLRLLAVGYNEIGSADMNKTAEASNIDTESYEDNNINLVFRHWVEQEFQVVIPETGKEIADFENKEFSNWIEKQIEKYSSKS